MKEAIMLDQATETTPTTSTRAAVEHQILSAMERGDTEVTFPLRGLPDAGEYKPFVKITTVRATNRMWQVTIKFN